MPDLRVQVQAGKTLSLPTVAARPREGLASLSPRPQGHGEMLVDQVWPPQRPALERRDDHPPQKPREPISSDSRTSLGLGATGTIAASIARV